MAYIWINMAYIWVYSNVKLDNCTSWGYLKPLWWYWMDSDFTGFRKWSVKWQWTKEPCSKMNNSCLLLCKNFCPINGTIWYGSPGQNKFGKSILGDICFPSSLWDSSAHENKVILVQLSFKKLGLFAQIELHPALCMWEVSFIWNVLFKNPIQHPFYLFFFLGKWQNQAGMIYGWLGERKENGSWKKEKQWH